MRGIDDLVAGRIELLLKFAANLAPEFLQFRPKFAQAFLQYQLLRF
jgi:hypothetical protein